MRTRHKFLEFDVYFFLPLDGGGCPPNIRQNTRRTRRAVWRELADPPSCWAERGEGNSLNNLQTLDKF